MEIITEQLKIKLTKKYLIELGLLVLLFVVGYILLGQVGQLLESPDVKIYLYKSGIWAPVIFAALYLVTIVIAPLPGFPLVIAGFDIFGIPQTVILNYSLSLIGAAINFYIARKWGRDMVVHFIGKSGLKKVDQHASQFSIEVLILTRLFDGFLFEWISYAAGLTNIRFRKYFLITIFASIPYNLILWYFASQITELGTLFITLSGVYYLILIFPLIYFLAKHMYLTHIKK